MLRVLLLLLLLLLEWLLAEDGVDLPDEVLVDLVHVDGEDVAAALGGQAASHRACNIMEEYGM